MVQMWEVVGGKAQGGILVRDGRDTTSPQLSDRLATGACVEEVELVGDRLCFRKLRGDGPERGWVTIKLKDKDLLVRAAEAPLEDVRFPSALGFERIANFRDVSATPLRLDDQGHRLRSGLLYRGGHWVSATQADIRRLSEDLGIKTYIDLREGLDFEGADAPVYELYPPSPVKQRGKAPLQREPGERRRLHCPFSKNLRMRAWTQDEKDNKVPAADRTAQTAWWFQKELRDEKGRFYSSAVGRLSCINRAILFINHEQVLAAMRACIDKRNYPLFFGCVAGKDRTGLMSCLVLGALGASDESILSDYLATNQYSQHINACNHAGTFMYWKQIQKDNPKRWDMMLKNGYVGALSFAPTGPGDDSGRLWLRGNAVLEALFETDASQAIAMLQAGKTDGNTQTNPDVNLTQNAVGLEEAVHPEIMEYTLKLLREECGGIRKYLESIGFGADDVAKLQEILVE